MKVKTGDAKDCARRCEQSEIACAVGWLDDSVMYIKLYIIIYTFIHYTVFFVGSNYVRKDQSW